MFISAVYLPKIGYFCPPPFFKNLNFSPSTVKISPFPRFSTSSPLYLRFFSKSSYFFALYLCPTRGGDLDLDHAWGRGVCACRGQGDPLGGQNEKYTPLMSILILFAFLRWSQCLKVKRFHHSGPANKLHEEKNCLPFTRHQLCFFFL